MKIAGLDIGSTGCKLTVFDESGTYLDKAYRDYPVKRTVGEHEVDPEAIRESVFAVLEAMAKKHPDIAGIGVTSFGEAFVMMDEKGALLNQAMLYTDPRGEEECRQLKQRLGEENIASITGMNPHEMYSISKIMWMKKHRPEVYQRARHIFLMEDFVVYSLTGKAQIDYSLASRTMAFDIMGLTWSQAIFEAAEVDMSLMSQPVPAGTVAGTLLPQAAKRCGLRPDTRIVSVSHDQVAAAVGAGVFDSRTAVDGAGTVECITPVYDAIPPLEVMRSGNYAVVPYAVPGKYVCYAFSYMGGALMQWCVDTLAKKEKELALEKGISVYDYLEEEPIEPTGLLVLPHFAGAATPYMDNGAKGVILGLTASTSLKDIYRGCMEGVVYEMLVNMEYLEKTGSCFQMLHATGGGANSRVWMQMKADMMNLPITALKTVDAGTVGSAILTGVAVGCFQDMEDGAAHMVKKKEVYMPRAGMHEKYRKVYERYRRVYQAVRPLV